jgi:hypothetical protein
MRLLVWAVLVACAALCGCSEMQEVQNNGGRAVNLLPTDRESRAGY